MLAITVKIYVKCYLVHKYPSGNYPSGFIFAIFLQGISMEKNPDLLLIGGNTRHIGKTTLACEIIRIFSATQSIVACKLTSIYKNDARHHGEHDLIMEKDFQITEELTDILLKDTGKMLRCGAKQAFYLQARDNVVDKTWQTFIHQVSKKGMLVCESRSLRRFVEPGIFIYLKSSRVENEKPGHLELEKSADVVITDPKLADIAALAKRISVRNNSWQLD